MRLSVFLVTVVLLVVSCSPMIQFGDVPISNQELVIDEVQHSAKNSANFTISPSSGWTTGGEEITITGTGFLDMAYKNVTSDGEAYTWTTTTANSMLVLHFHLDAKNNHPYE